MAFAWTWKAIKFVGEWTLGIDGLEDFKNVKIGNLDATPNFFGSVGADRVPPLFERYFTGLRISGPGNVAIKRS